MNRIKTKVAAGSTLLALGVLAAFALGSGGDGTGASAASGTQPTEVRTQTIRRTVHVQRHDGQNRGPGGSGLSPSSAGPPAAPVAPAVQVAPPAPAAVSRSGSDDRGDDGEFEDHDEAEFEDHDDDSGHGRGRGGEEDD